MSWGDPRLRCSFPCGVLRPPLTSLLVPRTLEMPLLRPEQKPGRSEWRERYCGLAARYPFLKVSAQLGFHCQDLCIHVSPSSSQRREKIERRQQEVETELKMCKSLSSLPQNCPLPILDPMPLCGTVRWWWFTFSALSHVISCIV